MTGFNTIRRGQCLKRVLILGLLMLGSAKTGAQEGLDPADLPGGLIVHVGRTHADTLAELGAGRGRLVQALMRDPARVNAIRAALVDRGAYGKITVDVLRGSGLPYAENLVNLLIVDDPEIDIAREEILRVLVPRGVALVNGQKIVKPIPEDIDDWSHFEHGPENNSVADDSQVGPPRHLQWVAGPRWLRTHEVPSGMSSMVTAGGRLFYTLDEGPIGISDARLPEKWSLIARDAFNGTQLWKIPLPDWGWQTWKKEYRQQFAGLNWIKSGGLRTKNPAKYVLRMVADDKRLYFTLGHDAPVSVIDAATGQVTADCEGSDDPEKLLLSQGVLCTQLAKGLAAYEAKTGRLLWKKDLAGIRAVAAHGTRLLYHQGTGRLHCVDLETCDAIWTVPLRVQGGLKISENRILSAGGSDMQLFSLETGQSLWCNQKTPSKSGSKPPECYIIDDTIWVGYRGKRVDLNTGAELPELGVEDLWSPQHHHRCYTNKATNSYIIGAMEGMEYLALSDEGHSRNNWVRGSCRYGIMPANGMTYAPPDQCYCSAGVKLLGLNALQASREFPDPPTMEARLEKGPQYGEPVAEHQTAQWPAYRHDALRSGSASASVPAHVKPTWERQFDPTITQPVVSGGRLFVASRDTHTIHAMDEASGRTLWRFTADGRIDSSPTCWKNLLLFGSARGTVHCLRQEDGGLVWTFKAARHDRLIQSYGQLESAWPLHGSVLIVDDLAYVAAGRSTYLDGGLYLYALEPATGKVRYHHRETGPHEDQTDGEGHSFWSEGARNDVLVSDGESIYIMQLRFNKKLEPELPETVSLLGDRRFGRHVFSTAGFLDDVWYNRTFWMHSDIWPGFYLANQASKSGQLLVFDDQATYGVKAFWTRNRHSPMFFPGTKGYLLFADDNDNEPILVGRDMGMALTWLPEFNMDKGKKRKTNWGPNLGAAPQDSTVQAYTYNKDKGIGYTRTKPPTWSVYVPIRVKAMVKTQETVFVAGAPDIFDEKDDPLGALEGRKGGVLRAVSAADGTTLSETELAAPPVLDGLIAVKGRLYLATRDGRLSCWK